MSLRGVFKFASGALFTYLFLVAHSAEAGMQANVGYVGTAVKNLYGQSTTFSCSICHTSSIPGLNGFGSNMLDASGNLGVNLSNATQSQIQMLVAAIAGMDSDGDAYTNEEEFRAGTDPSDRKSKPVAIATPPPPPVTVTPAPVPLPPVTVTPDPIPLPPVTVTPDPIPLPPTPAPSPRTGRTHRTRKTHRATASSTTTVSSRSTAIQPVDD